MILALVLYAPFLISAIAVMNWLPGVSAFLLCCALLQWADNAPRHRGLGVQYGLVILTNGGLALLAGVLGVLVVSVSSYLGVLRWPVTWLSGYAAFAFTSRAGALSVLGDALRLQPVIVPGLIFPSFGIWLYAPCFPLIWLGLYLLAGQCLRGAAACRCFPRSDSPYGLDIDGKPMQALGAVAVGLVSVLYWTAVLWCR